MYKLLHIYTFEAASAVIKFTSRWPKSDSTLKAQDS